MSDSLDVQIIPAVLPKNLEELEMALASLRGVAPVIQIDLVGENILANETAMPLWESFDFEFDIMLPDPAAHIEKCVALGASRIVVHADGKNAKEALESMQHLRGGSCAVEAGIALRAHDEPSALAPFEGLFDYVQVMGIDTIGVQGEPPDPHHKELELLKALRVLYPTLPLQCDGAVGAHPREVAEAGATRLVIGSGITKAEDPLEAFERLEKTLRYEN
ncbi:hypothetical protein A2419_02295 [Candidatus Adlerbacteria bacterium RIFOXYC1_FULL_48_26]|uniref:Ribulose-phosphate 3-epimerase n=1 Tax=Candidatus Adlerbacteria bacterium RIFOXYC1_FULL_48_26 TaxID=1797247 RepID=A0A1F4Y1U1_9BACT|nr:MAG: hypothetical protein A2419_02295 [Candidatus Adlerbacteria bacterium RIFOXYC1_FULL_48_26]OGC95884.1 MAG: hypothetical protein A2590_01310 [Candidatus Adlerbacteria bacterium RIFOXYD1_FULL_48_8]